MFSTCLFCHGSLGRNEVVEHFPVGRRLAFDAAKGRLWAICPRCSRWNLTPLEERWEAIEECERLFAPAPKQGGTDNVTVARPRGVILVRVGGVDRRELARWRFTRRMRHLGYLAAPARAIDEINRLRDEIPLGGYIVASAGLWKVLGPAALAVGAFEYLRARVAAARPVARVAGRDGARVVLTAGDAREARILDAGDGSHVVRVRQGGRVYDLTGDDAARALVGGVSLLNRHGARAAEIEIAAGRLERAERPEDYIATIIGEAARTRERLARRTRGPTRPGERIDQSIASLDRFTQVTLDMALSEQFDDAASASELAALEAAWREAEELAAIADSLLIPDVVERKLKALRRR